MTTTYDPLYYASEAEIQSAILDYLAARRILAFRVNSGNLLLQNADGSSRRIKLAPKGTADIIGIAPGGRFMAIEVKDRKGKQTPEQLEFEKKVIEAGGYYLLARSVEDVERWLKDDC